MKRFALAGNPNSGKTTLFNGLTGATAHVGNWPGVTVEKREGVCKKGSEHVSIVDLPGIYSLSPYTDEEVIARNFLLDEKVDCIINIVDATNFERNLYLTTQLLETEIPVVVALNMMDEVEKDGDKIDIAKMEEVLEVPVVKISALKRQGLNQLVQRAIEAGNSPRSAKTVLKGSKLDGLITSVQNKLTEEKAPNTLFLAIKLLEKDSEAEKKIPQAVRFADEAKAQSGITEEDFEATVADLRYKFITENLTPALIRKDKDSFKMKRSDKADRVLTHRIWGIPIFLLILFAIFHLTFSEDFLYLGAIFGLPGLEDLGLVVDGEAISYGASWVACFYDGAVMSPGVIINNIWNNQIVSRLFGLLQSAVEESGMASWAVGLINNGIIDGVCSVLSFLPPILTLFLFFSILEDSGYMARIAFILDKLLKKFGLSGRAILPMIMGFGCSVPAMINTRTLSDDKEKTATVRVIPFFSCGAKLPILTAVAGGIVSHFGVGSAELITYAMYLLGVVTAVVCVVLMRSTSLKGENPPFIMELPAYRMPQAKSLALHLWDKAKHFIKKAFTIIIASTIVIWALTHFNFRWEFLEDENINDSILAGLAMLVQPLFTPMGFGSQLGACGWVFAVAIVSGLIAKENVIGTFGALAICLAKVAGLDIGGLDVLAEDGVDAVQAMIAATGISVPALIAFIAFNMTTIPCFAAVGTAKAELQDNKKFQFTLLFWLLSSYIVAAVVYTVGTWWWMLFVWLAAAVLVGLGIVLFNRAKRQPKE